MQLVWTINASLVRSMLPMILKEFLTKNEDDRPCAFLLYYSRVLRNVSRRKTIKYISYYCTCSTMLSQLYLLLLDSQLANFLNWRMHCTRASHMVNQCTRSSGASVDSINAEINPAAAMTIHNICCTGCSILRTPFSCCERLWTIFFQLFQG